MNSTMDRIGTILANFHSGVTASICVCCVARAHRHGWEKQQCVTEIDGGVSALACYADVVAI